MTGEDVLMSVLEIVKEHNKEFCEERPTTVTLKNAFRSGRLMTFKQLGIEIDITPTMWGKYLRPRKITEVKVKFPEDDKWFEVYREA